MLVVLSVVEDRTKCGTKGRIAQRAAVLDMFLDLCCLFGRRVPRRIGRQDVVEGNGLCREFFGNRFSLPLTCEQG